MNKNSFIMNSSEIKSIVKDELNKFVSDLLDKEIAKLLKQNNSKSRNEMISTIKDSLEAVYKVLWQKREFWKTDIK